VACIIHMCPLFSGTVDGTAIGATTASTGQFTTLGATGRAVQVDPVKPVLKALGQKVSKLKHGGPLSILLQICFQIQCAPLHTGVSTLASAVIATADINAGGVEWPRVDHNYGGQGESLVPPNTRGSFSVSILRPVT
jgi:hypothetical protein